MEMDFTWQQLADVDSKITASLLDKDTCRSHKVTPVPKPRKLNKKLHTSLKSCYSSALENVSFQPLQQSFVRDSNYTSFGVFAKVFLDNNRVIAGLVGFLAPISESEIVEGVNDFSIFRSNRRRSGSKLMLGPASFINSCCKPNSLYEFDRKTNQLRIKVIKKDGIQPGEEVTVKYAGDYFGENSIFCCCPFTEYHGKRARMLKNWTRSGSSVRTCVEVPDQIVEAVTGDVEVETVTKNSLPSTSLNHKRCRIRGKTDGYSSRRYLRKFPKKSYRRHRSPSTTESSSVDSSSSSDEGALVPTSVAEELSVECQPMTSTPVHEATFPDIVDFCDQIQTSVYFDQSETSSIDTASSSTSDDELFPGSRTTVSKFEDGLSLVASKGAMSDATVKLVLNLFEESVTFVNNVPSFSSFMSREKRFHEKTVDLLVSNGKMIFLDLESQIRHLLTSNEDLVLTDRFWSPQEFSFAPRSVYQETVIHFILNTDGISPIKSSNFSLYPVWLMMANLPERRRCSYHNLILAAIFGGEGKPCWETLMQPIFEQVSRLREGLTIIIRGVQLKVVVEVAFVVCDMVAKASLLNQTQFNGRYGCPNCLSKGRTSSSKKVWIYPNDEDDCLRTRASRVTALDLDPTPASPIFGIKGKVFSN